MAETKLNKAEKNSSSKVLSDSNKDVEVVTLYISGDKVNKYMKISDSEKENMSLKRKKNLETSSLSSLFVEKKDEKPLTTLNSSKRMRIENSSGLNSKTLDPSSLLSTDAKVVSKPPIPPQKTVEMSSKAPKPPLRLKKKLVEAENTQTVNKLIAQCEQMRLEISELKVNLASEKNAVRTLRAQNESEVRKTKTECKKLQEALQNKKKSFPTWTTSKKQVAKEDNASSHCTNVGQKCDDFQKLNHEISLLKEANKLLEEKLHISSEAEKKISTDMRELKDSYEARLTQISKSAKNEIHKLLEELKSKERSIGVLKKEVQSKKTTSATNKKGKAGKCATQSSQEMRKLKEIECNSACNEKEIIFSTNHSKKSNVNQTTCGNDCLSMPHEMPERIMEAHNDTNHDSNKETVKKSNESDTDSALSSAPSSLSPQPCSVSANEMWQLAVRKAEEALSFVEEKTRVELEQLREKYVSLNNEYEKAKEQIYELEKTLSMTRDDDKIQKLKEKIEYFEQREVKLLKETHELREQNELLEFRIIELEESHDKWSLRSNPSPGTKDVWTDTEKENDELMLLSDRSDSGVTSPNSHQHSDDQQSVSPCDLSLLDQIPTDDVRKRIIAMSKRSCYDEEDKSCLQQVLSLLNNLEALSHDQEIANDDMSIEMPASKFHQVNYQPRSLPATSTPYKNHGKIVATVQPFNSDPLISSDAFTPPPTKRHQPNKPWGSASLQESGVFVDELCTQSTQTEIEDFPCLDRTNAELVAEIEKLNRFRQRIEQCANQRNQKLPTPPTETGTCDKRRLQFYVERLQILENKISVYESSGDLQIRRLAERLQREVQLESWVKQLTEKIEKMEGENLRLEEERCELEEIENDTRLRLQRLEVDLEVMNQRNMELEMSRDSYQTKFQDAKENVFSLEECLHKYEERIFVLEEHESELKHRLELIHSVIPTLLLYNSWQVHESVKNTQSRCSPTITCEYYESDNTGDLQIRLNDLLNREKELTQNISELNRAYNETLENADNLWAQMEKEYKDKIASCEAIETNLKAKISQLEERLHKDSEFANERISHLEDSEHNLKNRISKLNKENKEIVAKNNSIREEYTALKEDYKKLQQYLKGPAAESLEKERRKILELEEELSLSSRSLREAEQTHKCELGQMKGKLMSAKKELNHIEVTNSELREEVDTLETRIRELLQLRHRDEEQIRNLSEELQHKQLHLSHSSLASTSSSSSSKSTTRTLAQELEKPIKGTYSKLGYEIHPLARKFPDHLDVQIDDKLKFPIKVPETKEVKSLAETIISNAENRAAKSPKKSFVEEARSRFARWV